MKTCTIALAALASEKLVVNRLIGMHMSPTPWEDLESAIDKAGL